MHTAMRVDPRLSEASVDPNGERLETIMESTKARQIN